jgi:hypothetical protein
VFWGQIFPGGQYGMAEELTEKLIEKVREYVFFVQYKSPGVQKHCEKKAEAWRAFPLLIDFVHPSPSPFSFTTQC